MTPAKQHFDQRLAIIRQIVDPIARLPHRLEQAHGARRRVETDAVGDPAVAVGIVGEHDRDPPLGHRRGAEARPGRCKRGGEGNPVLRRGEADDIALGRRIEAPARLERDGPAQHAAIELRQGDVHRQIARRQPACAGPPGRFAAAREHHLEDRAVGLVQRSGTPCARRRDGEPGRVQDDRCLRPLQKVADQRRTDRVLEAGGEDRQRVQPFVAERLDQRIDHLQVTCLDQSPIEHQSRDRSVRLPMPLHPLEIRLRQAWPVQAGAHQWRRLAPGLIAAKQRGGVGEKLTRVVETAVHQVLPEPVTGLSRQGAPAPQLRVGLIVAWQHGELYAAGTTDRNDLLQTVGPVAATAEQAQYHQVRAADHLLDIQVDRHRMAELQEIGEAQARAIGRPSGLGCRETGQLGVSGRQEHDVAGRLTEVDRLPGILRRRGLSLKQMQGNP